MPRFIFGRDERDAPTWTVDMPSLARAIRAFRVGVLFPHVFSSAPIIDRDDRALRFSVPQAEGRRYQEATYVTTESAPGAYILVREERQNDPAPKNRPFGSYWPATVQVEVARIPVETVEDNAFTPALLASSLPMSASTAMTVAQPQDESRALTFETATRHDLEDKNLSIQKTLLDLERMKDAMNAQLAIIRAELKQRMEQVWLIELFLGSKEEVLRIRAGAPASSDTRISVRQRVLCMDEEMAVFQWFEKPESIGEVDCQSIEDFDDWLVSDPRHLDAICPWQKGLVGLRVRRQAKERSSNSAGEAFFNGMLADQDKMTYLLIRNGENLYRLWIDLNVWPRLFPSEADTTTSDRDGLFGRHEDLEKQERVKQQVAGLIALSGLLQRSDLFQPLPHPAMNPLNPVHVDEYFTLVRDDEERLLLGDGNALAHLSWHDVYRSVPSQRGHGAFADRELVRAGYQSWLRAQLDVGVRVMLLRRSSGDGKLEERTGLKSVNAWPSTSEVYTITARAPAKGTTVSDERPDAPWPWYTGEFEFMYLPDDEVLKGGWGGREYVPRTRRVPYRCYNDEILPVDYLSYRVLEHLIRDRGQRADYGSFFTTAFRWWRLAKAEADRTRPFIDLVLSRAGVALDDEQERARCERLVRWWKLKTKENRTIATDDAKALRMIEAAFRRGDDHENDPEAAMMRALRLGGAQ